MQTHLASTSDRDRILETLKAHRADLTQLGVTTLALFGSVARNEAHANSDIDLLVELKSPLTFDRYMDVKFYLEDLLGTKVDLVTWKSLKPQIRAAVQREAICVT
ncbi:nucleotidyltransferase family protein [Pantanalinema rosaneae CENA516]|uniref:nucleotidyltransferase family protein n=1 Tax=Pantanalinema rosaneae TaxID=1620701 RepID=UPI003D7008BE